MKTHKHKPVPELTVERPFSGPVSRDEYRRAHGGVCFVEKCQCGLTRMTNVNGRHVEQGEWTRDRLPWA